MRDTLRAGRRRAAPPVWLSLPATAYLVALLATTEALEAVPLDAEPATDPYAGCEAAFRARADYESAFCFYEVARQQKSWQRAATKLEQLLESHPDNHWPRLALGHVFWRLEPSRAEATYRSAAAGFRRQDQPPGEILARINLYRFLWRQGQLELADAEVERVAELADLIDEPIARAQSLILEAEHQRNLGHDLEAAYRLLRRAEPLIFPVGPYRLRRDCLTALGSVCHRLGRYREAMGYYRRLESLASAQGDDYGAALFKYNQANTLLAEAFEMPAAGDRDKLILMYRDALAAAEAAGHRSAEVQCHRSLGDLLSPFEVSRLPARHHYERCLALTRDMNRPRRQAACLSAFAGHLARWAELEEAVEVLNQSRELFRDVGDHEGVVRVEEKRMRMTWAAGPRSKALADTRSALDALENLRDRQHAAEGRAGLFGAWSDIYYWPAGRLFEDLGAEPTRASAPVAPPRGDLELAFNLAERLRARVLLEAVTHSRANAPGADDTELTPVLADLVRVQRRLLDTSLAEPERRKALRELERLELREAEARQRPRQVGPEASTPFATLTEVEAALAEDEALLSFQVALWQDVYGDFGGGSWLLAVTHQGTRAYRLPDRVTLRPAIRLFRGLFAARDGSEIGAASALGADLLADALADLPPTVDRLVIVPDGDLHLLPFAALRAGGTEPLTRSFQLSRVPSATLWLRWRRGSREKPAERVKSQGSVLALADPLPAETPASEASPWGTRSAALAQQRDWALSDGARLGSLPHARQEGRAVVRHLGAASRLLMGSEATEHHLKTTTLAPYRVLHFAAHAVIDSEHSQRSAVLLAPGAATEDGLLQPRDIAGLDLKGKVVVLSACQSASGTVLRGEGVLSLARAFFAAGAPAVVGSLWRLRDDEAAALFDRFYHHLAKGETVAGALAAAQDDRIRAGAPAAAWAGLTVLGDGTVVPVPGGRPPTLRRTAGAALAVALLALAVALLWRRAATRN